MISIPATCKILDCVRIVNSKGLCKMHYNYAYKRNRSFYYERMAWDSMKQRCTNPKHPQYKDYGARGIKVCKQWAEFDTFIKDMGGRPTDLHTLDRINNNGNYEPGNCRWATKSQQQINKRKMANNTSGYRGVSKDMARPNKWLVQLSIDGRNHRVGRFKDIEQAALQYDRAIIFFRGHDGITNIL